MATEDAEPFAVMVASEGGEHAAHNGHSRKYFDGREELEVRPGCVECEKLDRGAKRRDPVAEIARVAPRKNLGIADQREAYHRSERDAFGRRNPVVIERHFEKESGTQEREQQPRQVKCLSADELLETRPISPHVVWRVLD